MAKQESAPRETIKADVDPDVKRQLREIAWKRGKSMTDVLETMIRTEYGGMKNLQMVRDEIAGKY